MLVLTRSAGQSINIGNDIQIHFTQFSSGQVRIGIIAPDDVKILRSELLAKNTNSRPK